MIEVTIRGLLEALIIASACVMLASLLWWLVFDSNKASKTGVAFAIICFIGLLLYMSTLTEPIGDIILFTI